MKFLRRRTDLLLRRRTLRRFGLTLRELHEAGYIPAEPSLDSWTVHAPESSSLEDVEILLTSVADLTPSAAAESHAADDLARLLACHGEKLSRTDLLRVVAGYLYPEGSRGARRDLVRRTLAARETA